MTETERTSGHFRDRVRERDLDNFLVEELQASEPFRRWFLERLPSDFQPPNLSDIRLKKSPPRLDGRQTDVRLGWFADEQLKACVLIESKVTAEFQPGQAEAYVREADLHRSELGNSRCCTVLIAPAARLASLEHASFGAGIAVEEIVASVAARLRDTMLDPEVRARLAVRIDLLEALAGKRAGSAWTPVTVEGKRDFALAYVALANEIAPELRVRASTDGPKALTRFFDGLRIPAQFPARVLLKHEFGAAGQTKYANLQLSGASNFEAALRASGLLLKTPFGLARSEKSLFIREATPRIDPTADFEAQREEVAEGISVVKRLAEWFHQAAPRLAELLHSEQGGQPSSTNTEPLAENELTRAMRRICENSTRIGYRPGYLLDMIENSNGSAAAKSLIARPQVSEGFSRLWELGRPDLTVEALILEPRWATVFSDAERAIARRRLKGWPGLTLD